MWNQNPAKICVIAYSLRHPSQNVEPKPSQDLCDRLLTQPPVSKCGTKTQPRSVCDRLLTQPPVSKCGTKTQPRFCAIAYSLSHPSQNVEPKSS
ncbi:hypothetical protein PoB_001654700 [Plakobranchus ocellatus]|uniref:Uncharacterized protein n=1 Tax=Plakobranchus ocellatus TaxID=259542 RepID=A0AAV3Z688_9GAST|nr:hypothetical protein PoB_001654700 [Plakobranchus ocellatus]